MSEENVIITDRLVLRQWVQEDLEPFAKLNADPLVREFFPNILTREQSDRYVEEIADEIEQLGYGVWAVSAPGVADFIGFIGLSPVDFNAHFTPAVEIGWRLAREFWGKGYATEGANAVLQYGFETLGLDEIVSFTAEGNLRSRKVMEKIGMHRTPEDDFDHPNVAVGHKLRRHVLYRIQP